jgi:hypothetical protein
MKRRLVWLLAVAIAVALVVAALRRRRAGAGPAEAPMWPPFETEPAAPATGFVRPVDGGCPDGHPVKAKEASGIYHLPGMANYARTVPDRCYADARAAEADGFRAAKR